MAAWGDELHVTGPAGQRVQIAAHVQVSATGNRADTTADTYNYLYFKFLLPGMNSIVLTQDNLVGGYAYDQIFLLELLPGQYNISQELRANTNAAARINEPNPNWKSLSFALMDSGHTARLYLDVVSSEGGYTLGSGADLRTPVVDAGVPEPASTGLAAAGLAVLSIVKRLC